MKLQLALRHRCTVCDELLRSDDDDLIDAMLCGVADPYVLCPGCKQRPPASTRDDPEYRRRVRVRLFEHYGRVVREPADATGPPPSVWRKRKR